MTYSANYRAAQAAYERCVSELRDALSQGVEDASLITHLTRKRERLERAMQDTVPNSYALRSMELQQIVELTVPRMVEGVIRRDSAGGYWACVSNPCGSWCDDPHWEVTLCDTEDEAVAAIYEAYGMEYQPVGVAVSAGGYDD